MLLTEIKQGNTLPLIIYIFVSALILQTSILFALCLAPHFFFLFCIFIGDFNVSDGPQAYSSRGNKAVVCHVEKIDLLCRNKICPGMSQCFLPEFSGNESIIPVKLDDFEHKYT